MADLRRTESSQAPTLARASAREVLHLVLAWSTEQPELVGYAAPIEDTRLLGRGGAEPGDPAARLAFGAARPSGLSWGAALEGTRLSRRQLLITAGADGTLAVRSLGRCPLLVHGRVVESAVVGPGDTLVLHDLLVLLVVARRPVWFLERRHAGSEGWGFGAPDAHGIVGESPPAWELRESLARAAQSGEHVLVHGESGTGKELAAQAVHALSPRQRRAFVARNAATLPEGLVDAELFGNVRGYPHASMSERPGLIGEADEGTLFLDEIGEMRHDVQAHLLRVMDRGGEYQRLGEARPRRADVRLVAATNRPLSALKHDFTARFPVRVRVPGLNERPEDIPLLSRHLLASWAARDPHGPCARFFEKGGQGPAKPRVEPALVEALIQHEYSHHVRELSSLLWTAVATSSGNAVELTYRVQSELRAAERAAEERAAAARTAERGGGSAGAASGGDAGPAHPAQHEDAERQAIEAALAKTGGKVAPAAELLGLSRHALHRRLKRYGLRGAAGEGAGTGD